MDPSTTTDPGPGLQSSSMATIYPAGEAPIKAEYRISNTPILASVGAADDDAAEGGTSRVGRGRDARDGDVDGTSGAGQRVSGLGGRNGSGKMSKEQKKAQRGQNKARKFGKVRDELDLCWKVANGVDCEFGEGCRFTHDIPTYLTSKTADVHWPSPSSSAAQISTTAPYVPPLDEYRKPHTIYPSVDTATICPIWQELGECRYGFKCRFLGGHIRIGEAESAVASDDKSGTNSSKTESTLELLSDSEKKAHGALTAQELNFVGPEVQRLLRSRKYPFPVADAYLRQLAIENAAEAGSSKKTAVPDANSIVIGEPEQQVDDIEMAGPEHALGATTAEAEDGPAAKTVADVDSLVEKRTGDSGAAQIDTPDAKVRFSEKRRLNWKGKTYLAPLTTVGNLPFRRLCVDLGADITCGEMALAPSFLSGSKEEWSLVRRHPSERIFGVQVAGNKPANLVPAAEVLAKEIGSGVDFVDVNCGCPIDLVFKSGSGSALLDTAGKLGKILIGMNRVLGEIPVTVKLRTGVKDGKNTAHKLMPRLGAEWGVGCLTLHGRTRQQRYTRLADWDYIKQCVEAVRAREKDEDLPPIPIFGGGDCFSSTDYWGNVEQSGVDGVMIARGALIKPWIFTEVKERREWDISSRERMELIRKYAEYGLSHFGSDTTGVNTTRRYLCEALSFQYRYVPIGLLERLPGRINDRAPAFRGRDDLETLLASPDSQDWVKISEMFLGPAPETWSFTPKHKSNAYGSEEGQG